MFYPVIGLIIPICILSAVGIALNKRGRKWCDYFCPRGSFLDSIAGRISPDREIPGFLRSRAFRVFFLAFFMLFASAGIYRAWPHPESLGFFFVKMLAVTSALGIILAVFIHRRAWCSFCPAGTAACLAGRDGKTLFIDSGKCTSCGVCGNVCPLRLNPFKHTGSGIEKVKVMKERDCLKCGLCVKACPAGALKFG